MHNITLICSIKASSALRQLLLTSNILIICFAAYIHRCFTSALTAHVDEDDKSRLARKVSNLLQLALIPPETKVRPVFRFRM